MRASHAAQCLAVLSVLAAATAFSPLSSVLLRAHRRPLAHTGIRSLRAQESPVGEGPSLAGAGVPAAAAKQGAVGAREVAPDILERMSMLAREPPAKDASLSFICPAVSEPVLGPEDTKKPLLVFLPGIDGVGTSAEAQWQELEKHFELRVLQISGEDRTGWEGLQGFVTDWVTRTSANRREIAKPVVMGESMGSVVALAMSLRADLKDKLGGVVLVNPATSVGDTNLPQIADLLVSIPNALPQGSSRIAGLLGSLPDPFGIQKSPLFASLSFPNRTVGELAYGVLGGGFIAATAMDLKQYQNMLGFLGTRAGDLAQAVSRGEGEKAVLDVARDSAFAMDFLLSIMPAAAIQHRVNEVLVPGAKDVNARLKDVTVPVLLICGQDDNMLPSKNEGTRLKAAIPSSSLVKVSNTGHAALDGRFNLTRAILRSKVVPPRPTPNYVADFVMPSDEAVEKAWKGTQGLRDIVSPVFYSVDPTTGRVISGLGGLPEQIPGKPILFVGNHQVLALETGLVVGTVFKEKGILMRGLGHPLLFSSEDFGGGEANGNIYQTFGAVPVSPRNTARLMQSGAAVLLYPGGIKETVPNRDKETLAWPEQSEFIRIAQRYNATIVPFGGIGAADLVRVLADEKELAELRKGPLGSVLGGLLDGFTPPVPEGTNMSQQFSGSLDPDRLKFEAPPLFAPQAPWDFSRFYFLFGKPIEAGEMDVTDPDTTAKEYARVRQEVEGNIAYLKRRRPTDPYGQILPRVAYERINQRQAPSFDP